MKIEIPKDLTHETNVFYIRDLVSLINQLETFPYSIERKLAECDFFTKELEKENPFTRSDVRKILYHYTNHLLKLKV